jgi:hypothetical protein
LTATAQYGVTASPCPALPLLLPLSALLLLCPCYPCPAPTALPSPCPGPSRGTCLPRQANLPEATRPWRGLAAEWCRADLRYLAQLQGQAPPPRGGSLGSPVAYTHSSISNRNPGFPDTSLPATNNYKRKRSLHFLPICATMTYRWVGGARLSPHLAGERITRIFSFGRNESIEGRQLPPTRPPAACRRRNRPSDRASP